MSTWRKFYWPAVVLGAALTTAVTPLQGLGQRRKNSPPISKQLPQTETEAVRKQQPGAKESLEADVSARNVAVKASFNGVEIVVFGAVDNSQQPSPESGYYDLIIVVEGIPRRVIARRSSNLAGIWVNTSSVTFD